MTNELNDFSNLIAFCIVICPICIFLGYRQSKKLFSTRAANQDLSPLVVFWLSIPVLFGINFTCFYYLINLEVASHAYFVFLMLAVGVYLISWFKRKQEAGRILLFLGRLVNTKLLIANVMILSINFLLNNYLKFSEGFETTLDLIIYFIDWGFSLFLFLFMSLSRIDFREKGIHYFFTIIKWEAIKEYKWIESQDNVLYIRHKAGLPLMPILTLRIPLVKKKKVEQLLSQYLHTDLNNS